MNVQPLKIKCPVCGEANEPTSVDVDQGRETKIRADYICYNTRKRLFCKAKSCETKYSIEWSGHKAEQMLSAL